MTTRGDLSYDQMREAYERLECCEICDDPQACHDADYCSLIGEPGSGPRRRFPVELPRSFIDG